MIPFTLDVIRDQLRSIKELLRSSERQVTHIEFENKEIRKYIEQDISDKDEIFKKIDAVEGSINYAFKEIQESLKRIEDKLDIKVEKEDESGWNPSGWNNVSRSEHER